MKSHHNGCSMREGSSRGLKEESARRLDGMTIGPLHDPVTWYGINYTGTQITQWDFQNKGKSGWTGVSSFVLVPLRNLRPSVIYSVPCDRIVQRAYWHDN